MIKAVIFDLDNTLYDENTYFLKVFEKFSNLHGLNYNIFKEAFTDSFRLKSKDIFSDLLIIQNYNSNSNQKELFELYKTINCNIKLYNEAYKILNYLKKKKIKKIIITNGSVVSQKNKVKLLNLEKYIDEVIYAREFGKNFEKPNTKPFLEAIKLLNIKTNEAIYVGDHPYTDIKGANKSGIKALRFLNGYASGINYSHNENIKSLIEIKKYV
mgnify:CR=1 FL=1